MNKIAEMVKDEALRIMINEGIIDGTNALAGGNFFQGIAGTAKNAVSNFFDFAKNNTPEQPNNYVEAPKTFKERVSEAAKWINSGQFVSNSKGIQSYSGKSKGLCGAGVAGILKHLGFNIWAVNANQMGPVIEKIGFSKISSLNITPGSVIPQAQSGDIVIIHPFEGHEYGHIEMNLDGRWVSDFVQHSGNPYGETTCAGDLYRYSGN